MVLRDAAAAEERDDGQAAAEDKCAGLADEPE
jgi:hypothetical protein